MLGSRLRRNLRAHWVAWDPVCPDHSLRPFSQQTSAYILPALVAYLWYNAAQSHYPGRQNLDRTA
jgi:hypothetical protein